MDIQVTAFSSAVYELRDYYRCLGVPDPDQRMLVTKEGDQLVFVGAHRRLSWLVIKMGVTTAWVNPVCVRVADMIAAAPYTTREGDLLKLVKEGVGIAVVYRETTVVLPVVDGVDFPPLSYKHECGWGVREEVSWSGLVSPMRFLAPAICQDERHPNLRVLDIGAEDMVASDGHRLHVFHMPGTEAGPAVVSLLGAREHIRLPREVVLPVSIFWPTQAFVSFGTGFIRLESQRMILYGAVDQRAEYPDWKRVLPEISYSLQLDVASFLRVLVPMLDSDAPLLITKEQDHMVLEQRVEEEGAVRTYRARLPVSSVSGFGTFPGVYAFNSLYLYQAVQSYGSGELQLHGRGVTDPVILLQIGTPLWSAVMPMRR